MRSKQAPPSPRLLLPVLLLVACATPPLSAATPRPRAAAAAPIPVAFEGSALLITYYSAISGVLLDRGVIQPGTSTLSGLSGGAFTAVAAALGLSGKQQKEFFMGTLKECLQRWGSCTGHMNAVVEERLYNWLPNDVASRGESGDGASGDTAGLKWRG